MGRAGEERRSGNPRALALEALVRVERGGRSDRVLDELLRATEMDPRDRRLATELVYGVLRRRSSLDRCLRPSCSRPLAEVEPAVRAALRLGVYQLGYLDRVPAHAAVDATVEALKARRPRAAGFVNAVLRATIRGGDIAAAAAGEADGMATASRLALRYDVPAWWASRWLSRCGEAAAAGWLEASLEAPRLALRPHPAVAPADQTVRELRDAGVALEPSPLTPGCWRVVDGNPLDTPPFRRGAFALRSEAAQLVAACLGGGGTEPTLDACCGRGGKAVQRAEDVGGPVVAADLSEARVRECRRLAARAGVGDRLRALVADLTSPPLRAAFGACLVDAPCSGLGTVRRHPEIKWRAREEDLVGHAALQVRLLARCLALVRPGGEILYVTCSTEPEENERVVEAALDDLPSVRRRPVRLPDGAPEDLVGEDGYLRTFPTHPELDGFFAARLVHD